MPGYALLLQLTEPAEFPAIHAAIAAGAFGPIDEPRLR